MISDDDLRWQISNAVGCLREVLNRDKTIPVEDARDEIRMEAHRLALEYAIEVVKGIGSIEPPKRLDARAQLLRGRNVLTDGVAQLLENAAYWFHDLGRHERMWRDE